MDFCYATTEAERRPLVVSVPIPLRTQLVGTAQEVRGTSDLRGPEWNVEPRDAKLFYVITGIQKSTNEHLTQTILRLNLTFHRLLFIISSIRQERGTLYEMDTFYT